MNRTGVLLAILALLASSAVAEDVSPSSYLALAREALKRGEQEAARHLLVAALEVEPRAAERQEIRRMLGSGDGQAVLDGASVPDIAAGLLRSGKPEEALDSLAIQHYLQTPDASEVAILSLIRLSRAAEAERLSRYAVAYFPDSPRLYVARARAQAAAGLDSAAVSTLETASRVFPDNEAVEAELVLASDRAGDAEEALRNYLERFSADPRVYSVAIRHDASVANVEAFFGAGGNDRQDLIEQVWLTLSEENGPALRAFEARVAGFSGSRIVDRDSDGVPEQTYDLQGDHVVKWSRDADQDGKPDTVYDGSLSTLTVRTPHGQTVYSYDPYPYLKSVAMGDPHRGLTYLLPARRLKGPWLSDMNPLRLLEVTGPVPGEGLLRLMAVQILDRRTVWRKWTMDAARPVVLEEDLDGDGRRDRTVVFENGVPMRGYRDLDGDGRPEITELWSAGRLLSIEADLDGNGSAEVVVDLRRGQTVWDLDGDGKPDRSTPVSAEDFASLLPQLPRLSAEGPAPGSTGGSR